jgi:glycosyltransferase involved in cell wall biosynthesis
MATTSTTRESLANMLAKPQLSGTRNAFSLSEKLKIIMLVPVGKGVGGIINGANALIHELRKRNYVDLKVIDTAQRYRDDCDRRFSSRALGGSSQMLSIFFKLLVALWAFRPKTVSIASSASYGLIRDILLCCVSRMFGARVHISFHFGRIPDLAAARNWEWHLLCTVVRIASVVSVLDHDTYDVLNARFPHHRIYLTPNAVDIERIDAICARTNLSASQRSTPLIVFAGMVLETKGVVELVEACTRISSYDFNLEIVGPFQPAMQERLSAIAAGRNRGKWLSFAGALTNEIAVERIASADMFVLPSYSEGFPMSILEAMAAGTPIVATDVGAISEMLRGEDGEIGGIIVLPRDIAGLQRAIECLLGSPYKRQQLSMAARQKCESAYKVSMRCDSMLVMFGME